MANFYGTDIDDAAVGGAFVNYYDGDCNDFLNGNANPMNSMAAGVMTT